jgi:hypothetical protein
MVKCIFPAHLELLQVVLYMTFCNFTRNSFYPCYKDVYLTFPLHSIDTYFGGNVLQRGNCVILLFFWLEIKLEWR